MKTFDISPSDRAAYVRRPIHRSLLDPGRIAVTTTGRHHHDTFAAWSAWLRLNYLTR